jgi:hypothetical protein
MSAILPKLGTSRRAKGSSSLTDLSAIDGLLVEISQMLDLSAAQRGVAAGLVGRALAAFERDDAALRLELAELPGDLDLYLKLVRDRKKLEQKRKQLEAAASVSHALNFHLGNGDMILPFGGDSGGARTLMDELREEEAELDRRAAEADRYTYDDNDDFDDFESSSEPRGQGGQRRSKKRNGGVGGGGGQRAMRAEEAAEAEAHAKYNMRDGLLSHLAAAQVRKCETPFVPGLFHAFKTNIYN